MKVTHGEIRDALFNLTVLTECRCDSAWTDRQMHHPSECHIDFREDVDVLRDALESEVL